MARAKAKHKTKRKTGRPSKYASISLKQVEALAGYGLTDVEIAHVLGIAEDTLYEYRKQHPAFSEALKSGKVKADAKVIQSLYKRATGYKHPDVHVSNYQGQITITPLVKHYPPDTVAGIFWLKNRRPKDFRDRRDAPPDDSRPRRVVFDDDDTDTPSGPGSPSPLPEEPLPAPGEDSTRD